MIPPAILDQVRQANDIVEVISASVPLKRAGANYVALCPFHKEKTPSFSVNPGKQIFHCFGCNKGGNVFRFVQEYENLSFREAVHRLAERARIPIEHSTESQARDDRAIKEALYKIHEQLTVHWQKCLQSDKEAQDARDYLVQRGVSQHAIDSFRLGYAPNTWDDTVNWLRQSGFSLEQGAQAGVIIQKSESSKYYDRFRGRLIFPISDEQGRIIGFSGRILDAVQKTAKYVNSPETALFTKGKVIYGLDKAKRALIDKQSAIICEGQLDLIACHSAGSVNVVAPQGTALTAQHARIIKRYVGEGEVILCFDSDSAGKNAAVRSLDCLLNFGLAIRVAEMPTPHDPDSYIKEYGADSFQKLIGRADSFFNFYLDTLCSNYGISDDRGKMAIVRAMGEQVQKTKNSVIIDTYAQKTAQRLGVSTVAVFAEFKKATKRIDLHSSTGFDSEEIDSDAADKAKYISPPALEHWLLKYLLLDEQLIQKAEQVIDLKWISHEGVKKVIACMLNTSRNGQWRGAASLLAEIGDENLQDMVSEAVSERREIPLLDQQFTDCLLRLRNHYLERRIQLINQSLSGLSPSGASSKLLELNALRREKKSKHLLPIHSDQDSDQA
jgi:DNA primase